MLINSLYQGRYSTLLYKPSLTIIIKPMFYFYFAIYSGQEPPT